MRSLVFPLLLTSALVMTSVSVEAQEYRASPEPRAFLSDNPFRLYLLRGGDTIGPPQRGISVFTERWEERDGDFEVIMGSRSVGLNRRTYTDTMSVSRRGVVRLINGRQEYEKGEWDAFLRLPDGPVDVGRAWSDTLDHPIAGPGGPGRYRVVRDYDVTGRVDTLGYRAVLRVEARGTVDFRLSAWSDSTAGTFLWWDVSGPVEEVFYFAPDRGEWVARRWEMALEGIGGESDGTTSDTVPAGLRSSNRRYPISMEVAEMVGRDLPGADTSFTVRNGTESIFLHTARPGEGRWEESLSRADGAIGTATVEMDSIGPVTFEVVWTDLTGITHRDVIAREDGTLVSRTRDWSVPLPEARWAITDYGMEGLLVPSVMSLRPSPDPHELWIYRPVADRWDRVDVRVSDGDGFRLAGLTRPSETGYTLLIIDVSDGNRLLYVERQEPEVLSQRLPPLHRQGRLQEIIQTIQGGR